MLSFSRQPKVRQPHSAAIRADKDIVGLQITMVYAIVVAILESVDDLKEYSLHESVLADEGLLDLYRPPHIATRAIVEDDIEIERIDKVAAHSDDVGMSVNP
jgi:hypothetical protein